MVSNYFIKDQVIICGIKKKKTLQSIKGNICRYLSSRRCVKNGIILPTTLCEYYILEACLCLCITLMREREEKGDSHRVAAPAAVRSGSSSSSCACPTGSRIWVRDKTEKRSSLRLHRWNSFGTRAQAEPGWTPAAAAAAALLCDWIPVLAGESTTHTHNAGTHVHTRTLATY